MSDEAPFVPSDLYRVLDGVDNGKARRIVEAFSAVARETGATMGEAAWALAQLQAQLMASAPPDMQMWWAARLGDMCQLALPAALMQAVRAAAERAEAKPH